MAVSSANILVLVLWMSEKGKSLHYTMYSSGESTEPWGTPALRWTVFERVLFTLILQDAGGDEFGEFEVQAEV
jgi:hypothetical protein